MRVIGIRFFGTTHHSPNPNQTKLAKRSVVSISDKGDSMDKIEARKNKQLLCDEIEKLQNLSRSMMTAKEMIEIDAKISRHKEQIKNINWNLKR